MGMTEKLFLSFWALSLENLPVGQFIHRVLDVAEAKHLIDQAQQHNKLICVSAEDLLAPYNQRNLDDHKMLCQILQQHFRIEIKARDFCSSSQVDGEALFTTTPLQVVQISSVANLMVVNCCYSLPESRSPGRPNFQIAPDSVEFHLITLYSEHDR